MAASPPPRSDATARWQARPGLARLVRGVALAAPILVSTATVFALSRFVQRPSTLWPRVAWWIGSLVTGSASMVGTERVARRLLPLAALLRLSLVFPDAAPPRFGLALRRGSLRTIERDPSAAGSTPSAVAAEMARLVSELQAHDRRTRGHAERVRAYSVLLGEQLGLDEDDADRLQWAALLHDIGKLSVPASVLNKPGKLDDAEFAVIKGHPGAADELLEPLRGWLGDWIGAAGQHHEKYDGSGYPRGLAGTEISLAGRIVAVADAFDVMTAARSYKRPQDPAVARAELTRCAGTHFDPMVVRAFLNVSLGGLRRVLGPLSWLTNLPVLGSASAAPIGSVGAGVASVSVATGVSVASATILPAVASVLGLQLPVTPEPQHRDVTTELVLARTDGDGEAGGGGEGPGAATDEETASMPGRGLSTLHITSPTLVGHAGSATTVTTVTTVTISFVPVSTTGFDTTAADTSAPPAATTSAPPPGTTTSAPPPGTTTSVPAPPTTPPPDTTTTTVPATTTTVPATTSSTTTSTVPTTTTTVPTTTTSTTTTTVPTTTTTTPAPAAVDDAYSSLLLSRNGTQQLTVRANDTGSSIRVISVTETSRSVLGGTANIELHDDDVRVHFIAFVGTLTFSYTIEDDFGRRSTAEGTITLL